ncbi:MAG: lnt [Bacteroidetes bacterium]|nr:lnt [Bacteroidota bacterium]
MRGRLNNLILSLLSAVLLSASWYCHLTILIFFAFVPLLLAEDNISSDPGANRKLKVFRLALLTFVSWNVLVTWWVYLIQFGKMAAILAFVANGLLMAIVFLIFSNIKKRINKSWAVWLLIPVWLAWEHGHSLWDLAWTWLTLGNSFAFNHQWVQWYEFTGTSGGSAWALFVNILIFKTIKNYPSLKIYSKPILKIAAAIILPVLFSYLMYALRKPLSKNATDTVIVQPNIDPYNDKFELGFDVQFKKMLGLIKGKVSSKTEYLVLPETFIIDNLDEDQIEESEAFDLFNDSLIKKFPRLKIVVGASTIKFYRNEKDITATARKYEDNLYFDYFNTALQIDSGGIQIYHKSKLVPGSELMPFPALLKPLENFALEMGGTVGSLGLQKERASFKGNNNTLGVAPVVCYESVFSDYVTGYIRKGATFIFIITNDGWWDDSPGYVQHLNYARLRAIENRRQIARCANTGTSCFIDELGNISEPTKWWQEAVIQKNIYPNKELTFYSRFGDLLSYASCVITLGLLGFALLQRFNKKA